MILVDLCQILTDRPVKSTSLCKVLLRIGGHDSRQVAADVWENRPGLRNGEHDSRLDVWNSPTYITGPSIRSDAADIILGRVS